MRSFRQLFPLGMAHGEAFCNRVKETEQLVGHIEGGKHALLVAPRRYGKSSLAERAIEKSTLPSAKVNFHLSTSEDEVAELILDAVIKLIGSAVGRVDQLMSSVKKYLLHLEPLLSFGNEVASLKLVPKKETNHAVVISEALSLLESLLKEKNKKAVLFLDEFQEIVSISKKSNIEGAIRTAAQEMQHLSLLFSGGIRSLLLSMFEDEQRPLYKLCRKIKLDRIHESDYKKHINHISMETWGNCLDDAVFEQIMNLSNRHPYYVNYLCDIVWETCATLPTKLDVEKAWKEVLTEEWGDALKELSDLPVSQRRVLKLIATGTISSIQSQAVSLALAMPTSSIATAVDALIEKDYIEHTEEGRYQVINPLLRSVFSGETRF